MNPFKKITIDLFNQTSVYGCLVMLYVTTLQVPTDLGMQCTNVRARSRTMSTLKYVPDGLVKTALLTSMPIWAIVLTG